jgi:AcrR family transcriptional regulator
MNDAPPVRRQPRGAALLQPDRTRSIWRAAIIELARVGYDRLSMESVARRAGVGKAALYRRWPGKEAMIIALIEAVELEIVSAADKGSLCADVRDYLEKAFCLLRRPLATRILPDLYAEMGRDTALASAIRSTVQQRKRESVSEMIDRAVARGELPRAIDHELAFDLIVGPIYWRALVTRSRIGDAYLDQLAAGITASLRG